MGINKNFVVRNGLEVAENLFYVDDVNTKVGVKTANPDQDFHVRGSTKLEGSIVSAGNTTGVLSQYLRSTGDGWEWASFPISRQSAKFTLTTGQTRIPATGTFGSFTLTEDDLTSVYLDGVKLTSGSLKDYVIDVGGGSITLSAAAFGGEEIEIIAHGASGIGAGTTGILGVTARKAGIDSGSTGQIRIFDFVGLGVTLDGRSGLCTVHIDSGGLTDVSGDPTPILGGNLDLDSNDIIGTGNINITGIITATSFSGDGSDITGISTLNITNYGAGLGGGANVAGLFGKLNNDASVGIFTDSAAVGLGTTNPRFQTEIGAVGAAGTQLWVNGDARITGILTVGSSSITLDGTNDEIRIGTALTLTSSGAAQYTGVVTASGFNGDLVGQHKVFTAGVSNSDDYDIALFLNPTQGGHTFNRYDLGGKLQYNPSTGQLSNVGIISATGQIISGVTTHQEEVNFQSNVNFGDNDIINVGSGNDLQISHTGTVSKIEESGDGGLEFRANPSITIGRYGTTDEMASFRVGAGVSLFYNNSKKFETTGAGVTVTGILTATSFVGDGSNITGISTLNITNYGVGLGGGGGGGDTVTINATATDILSVSSGDISADDPGADRLVFWDDSESKLTYLTAGSGLSISGTEITATGGGGGISNVVEDTTPQLGGDLDVDSNDITGTGNINLTGVVTATSFVKSSNSGGFLKADGTEDTNTYLTSYTETQTLDDVLGLANVSGIGLSVGVVTATSFVGDGSNITGISTLNITDYGVGLDDGGISSVFEDTAPQLGGNLNLNGSNINGTGDIDITGGVTVSGASALNGNITLGEFTSRTITVNGRFIGDLNPAEDDIRNFGTSSLRWKDLYLSGKASIGASVTATQFIGAGVSVTGALNVSGISSATAESGSFTATAGVAYTANTYAVADFVNAEYTLFFQHSSGIQSQKVLVMDDGTTAYAQEYGIMYSNDLLVSVGATVKSGNVELEWTPETGVNGVVTYRYTRETMI